MWGGCRGCASGMAASAIPQWQDGVVAIGARLTDGETRLAGTGWLVDLQDGLVCTCAHVVLDCHPWSPQSLCLDAHVSGVAIGVGVGEQIRWVLAAKLQYLSMPPTDMGYPHADPPAHWLAPGDGLHLDLAVLKICNLDGSALTRPISEEAPQWHRTNPPIALPLGRAAVLSEGDELVLLGYGQGMGMGHGVEHTSTTSRGFHAGKITQASTGDWLKCGITIYSCAVRGSNPR